MKIVEFDEDKNPKPASGERKAEPPSTGQGRIKVMEFGSGSGSSSIGVPKIEVGKIKIREFGDRPSGPSASSPSASAGSSGLGKAPAFRMPDRASIKIVEFGEEKRKPQASTAAERPRGMKIVESDK